MTLLPFTISIKQDILEDLRYRLAHTRWPDEASDAGWAYGMSPGYMQSLTDYSLHHYDWQKQRAALNRLPQYMVGLW